MPQFRAYKLNQAGRIVNGEWIEAADETEARRLAHQMCDDSTPQVELWIGARQVAILPCESAAA